MSYETAVALIALITVAAIIANLTAVLVGLRKCPTIEIGGGRMFWSVVGVSVLGSIGLNVSAVMMEGAQTMEAVLILLLAGWTCQVVASYYVGTFIGRRAYTLNRNWTWGLWAFVPFALFVMPFVGPKQIAMAPAQ